MPVLAVKKLIEDLILPSFKDNKMYINPGEIHQWLIEDMLPNRDVQKFLFLNQFNLKKIFDKLCQNAPQMEELPTKKDIRSLKRKSNIRKPSYKRFPGNSKVKTISEEPEKSSQGSKTPTRIKSRKSTSPL